MTDVNISWLRPDLDNTYHPAEGTITFTPTAKHLHELAVVVEARQHAEVTGNSIVSLAPTGPDWCWKVEFNPHRAKTWTTHVMVPDVDHVVDFVDLTPVDPDTLEPSEEALAGWNAILGEVRDLHTETRDGARTVREDTTTTRTYRDQAQQAAVAATSAGYSTSMSPDYPDALRIFYPATISPRPFVVRLPIGETP